MRITSAMMVRNTAITMMVIATLPQVDMPDRLGLYSGGSEEPTTLTIPGADGK
jgi:hypothetical protein